MKKLILLFLFFLSTTLMGQYSLAPEVWSIPKKVTVISEWAARSQSPSISFDKQKLYFEGLAVTEWTDTGWTVPQSLPNHINQHLACCPCIAPSGTRLFFVWFLPTWNLYYSDWDSTANDWGPAINCGPNVNNPSAEGCVLPNDTTLIFLRQTETHISYWDRQTQTWGPSERWPTTNLWFQSDWGIYVSRNFGKVYLEGVRADTTIGGQYYLNYDIVVCYRDTTNPMGYKSPKILNFCLYADTQYFAGNYSGRFEGFPTITPDGKKMYFTTDYDSQTTIYESTLLIDENGNPVSVEELPDLKLILNDFILFQNYPNPFNPTTKIHYIIGSGAKQSQFVTLKVYDVLGNEIATLVNEEKPAGEYDVEFNSHSGIVRNLPSGVYFYQLKAGGYSETKKMVLMK